MGLLRSQNYLEQVRDFVCSSKAYGLGKDKRLKFFCRGVVLKWAHHCTSCDIKYTPLPTSVERQVS